MALDRPLLPRVPAGEAFDSTCSKDSEQMSAAGDFELASDADMTDQTDQDQSSTGGRASLSDFATPRAGEIRLASPDVTPKSCESRRTDPLDSCAGSPEATEGNEFCIVSADDRTLDSEFDGDCASEALEIASPEPELQETPLHFHSRIDGRDHTGQLIRNVELLGRRYLVVRTEPTKEDLQQGMRSIIHVFGLGFLNASNDDVVILDRQCEETAESSSDSEGEAPAEKASKTGGTVEEPGIFVLDSTRFRQRELLGSGGFADVYRYEKLDAEGATESFAVKEVDLQILSSRVGADQERLVRWVARLEFEVRNLMKLRGHPGVVKVHDAFAFRRKFYIVMEYVHGTDLGRRLKGRGRFTELEARGLFAQMAEALRHSHALDVVHRDFKPHNILLASPLRPGQPDVVKLVDFGLSKDISGCASGTSTPFLGTKYYRAPETRHATPGQENYDAAKVDVYALGVTLYAMLAGTHPQEGDEVTELMLRGTAWQRVSPEAKDLLLGLLKHEPEHRLSLDDVIEHPWLCALWATGAEDGEQDATPEPPEADGGEEEPALLGPNFLAAFPEAPATSSAARIPAEGGSSHGSPVVQSASAPGWENVLSWLHADAASAQAQQVLSHAGKAAAPSVAFGRAPLGPGPGRAGLRSAAGPQPPQPAESATAEANSLATSLSGVQQADDSTGDGPPPDEEKPAPDDRTSAPARIKWVSCAPRFASVWRYSQAAADSPAPSPSPSPAPSPGPSLPSPSPSPPIRATEDSSRDLTSDGLETRQPAQRHPSVIGFVQAPRLLAVDGAMVTITRAQRGSRQRPWGFVSETCRKFGFASREEAMLAAEEALLGQAATG
ncbi:fhkD [Symbiodinium sp. CCMP2456]|nr:fhkD [Symbiodinium sp. CCMP2456]